MISQKQILEAIGEQLTLFPVASRNHASHSQQPGSGKAQTMTDISGRKCLELFERSNLGTSWAKMFVGLLIGQEGWYSTRCALTWKLKVTKSSRYYFQLQASTLPTEETESGLLLTPTTREEVMDLDKFKARMEKYPNGTTIPNLATQINSMLPTPNAFDWNTARKPETFQKAQERHKEKGVNLQNPLKQMAVNGMLPTPTARCWNTGTEKERPEDEPSRRSELNHLMAQETGKPSQLSPQFVMEMMGFPTDWTLLPFLNGEKNPSKEEEML